MGDLTPSVTDQTFHDEVLNSQTPVLVDFWAEWCGPCRQVAPILEEVAKGAEGKLRIVKLNVDENPETTTAYKVSAIPTLLVFENGQVTKTIVGAPPKRRLLGELESFI